MTAPAKMNRPPRVELIDAARGLSIVLMVIYHFFYDLTAFCGFPEWLFRHPAIDFLQLLFSALFVAMSGASSIFSHSPVRRGIRILLCAGAVSLITWFFNPALFVRFGILHFLGTASLIYALLAQLLDRFRCHPLAWIALFVAIRAALASSFDIPHLWMFGFRDPFFSSSDYFPIFPWIFMYFFGVRLGQMVVDRKMPLWFYTARQPTLAWIGRKSLWFYLLHQPVLMGITQLILFVQGA